jgi:hypothetical protein
MALYLAMDRMHKLHHIPIESLWQLSERGMPTVGVINPPGVADVASDVICIGGKDVAVIVTLDNQRWYGQALHQLLRPGCFAQPRVHLGQSELGLRVFGRN